jgi:hypothetical protein
MDKTRPNDTSSLIEKPSGDWVWKMGKEYETVSEAKRSKSKYPPTSSKSILTLRSNAPTMASTGSSKKETISLIILSSLSTPAVEIDAVPEVLQSIHVTSRWYASPTRPEVAPKPLFH